jgi:putative acetyltransferase
MMQYRWATPEDAADLADVFFASVREGPSPYTEAQRSAWLPARPDLCAFGARLAPMRVALAGRTDELVGFLALTPAGYVELAYIRARARGQGIFRCLYDMIEGAACDINLPRLWTHASLTAQPAFRAMGFSVIQHETVGRAGEWLARAEMEKQLR